jgi:hypothetical protein
MIAVLTLIKSEVGQRVVHPNDRNDVDTVLNVKIHEAIVTLDREVLEIKFPFHTFLVVLEVKHVNTSLGIFDAVENGKFGSGDEALHLLGL